MILCINSCCRLCQSREVVSLLKLASTPPQMHLFLKKVKNKAEKIPFRIILLHKLLPYSTTEWLIPELFEDYVYVSGTSDVFVNHFMNFAKDVVDQFKPSLNNYVLDIGSNDGTLLKFLKEMGYSVIEWIPQKIFQ